MKRYTREELRLKLQQRLDAKLPILACEAGVGLTAKMTQKEDIDLIFITTAAMFRMRGLDDSNALKAYGCANEDTWEQVRRMNRVIREVPVVAGISANDPRLVLDEQLSLYEHAHVSGIINSPSVGPVQQSMRRDFSNTDDMGICVEKDMLKYAQERDFFSVYQAYFEHDALDFAAQKPDMIVINMDYSVEPGANPETYRDHDRFPEFYYRMFNPAWMEDVDGCLRAMQDLYERIKAISPETFVLVAGGPFIEMENVRSLFRQTDLDGILGGVLLEENVIRESIGKHQAALQSIRIAEGE